MKFTKNLPFEDHVKLVANQVRGILADLLSKLGADPTRPQNMTRQFGMDKNLTWKVSKIVSEPEACAAIPHIPGKAGINILLKSLADAGASERGIASLRTAFAEFDKMVKLHANDRATLEIMLGHLAHKGEHQRNEGHRKLSFLGNSATWGVQARVQLTTNFIAPGTEKGLVDLAWLSGLVDFRRLRSDVVWTMASAKKTCDDGSPVPLGRIEPIDSTFKGEDQVPLMSGFCSQPIPDIRLRIGPNGMLRYELVEGPVGNTAAVTCMVGLYARNFMNAYRKEKDTLGEHISRINTPVEWLIHDLFVHKDLSYALDPRIHLYSQLTERPVYPDGGRDHGRLPLSERVLNLGQGLSGIMTLEVPMYKKMVRTVYDRLDWDSDQFVCYRLKMRYPPIPSLAVYRYKLPEKA